MSTSANSSAAALRPYLSPITGSPGDYDRLLERVGDARLVLVGDETPSGLKGNHRRLSIRPVTTVKPSHAEGRTLQPAVHRIAALLRNRR
jgi:hypothetical protein